MNPAPFLGPDPDRCPARVYSPFAARTVRAIAALRPTTPHLVLLDLPPRVGISVAVRLNRKDGYAVAPMIQRWPAPDAVLPAARLDGWLVAEARQVGRPRSAERLAIVLDGERGLPRRRLQRVSARTLVRRFDNRYWTSIHLLPRADWLRSLGVTHLLIVAPEARPPDLADWLLEIEQTDIALVHVPARPESAA